MNGSAKRKCLCCGDFFAPDRRNVRHQRYCSKPACCKESKALSQRRWLQSQRTKITSADPKTASVSKTGAKPNPATGAKRSLQPKYRYKISSQRKKLTMRSLCLEWLRMQLSLWDLNP
jgi:hypothetical protein